MVTYFNKKDMVDFANYMMSPEVMNRKSPTQQLVVTDADFRNWKLSLNKPASKKMKPRDKFNLTVHGVVSSEPKENAEYAHTFEWVNPDLKQQITK